jgi:hypothetical protein
MSPIENSIAQLSGENYFTWSFQMKLFLKAKDLWDIEANKPKSDASADSTIANSVHSSLLIHIADQASAPDMWEILKSKFASKQFGNIFRAKQQLFGLSKEEFKDVENRVQRVKLLTLELKNLGQDVDELDKISAFLQSLPTSFEVAITAISNVLTETSTFDDVVSRFVTEELRQKSQDTEKALKAGFSGAKKKCIHCGKTNHPSNKCFKLNPCAHCGMDNHGSDFCFQHRAAKNQASKLESANLSKSGNKEIIDCYDWLFDSGASSHMTSNRELFEIFHHLSAPIDIELANDSTIQAIGIGDVLLYVNEEKSIRLKNALYVPELSANLISISRMVSLGNRTIIDEKGLHCIDANGNEFATGRVKQNLYVLGDLVIRGEACNKVRRIYGPSESLKMWHHRMGHLNSKDLSRLEKVTTGMKISDA